MAQGELLSPQMLFAPAWVRTGRVRLRTLALIRWVAIFGQVGALLFVHYGLGFSLPLVPAFAAVAASALLNVVTAALRPGAMRIGERTAAAYLAFDVCQLATLLYLTGGLQNPFAILLIAPIAVSATVLSGRVTAILCALTLIVISIIAVVHRPLPWTTGRFDLPLTYVLGMWVALTFGILFLAAYTWRVTEEARRMSQALSAAQLGLVREQRASALGALAAAAAHELGTPLGTIAVTAREIARELPEDSPLAEDARLLLSQTERCRNILAELAQRPDTQTDGAYGRVPIDTVIEAAAKRNEPGDIELIVESGPMTGTARTVVPLIAWSPEIIHGVATLVENALSFADTRVTVATRWSADEIAVTIADDGPGFPPGVLERLGEPYVSVRDRRDQHMGLGVFIAQTLLGRSGAELAFRNRTSGGAEITARWDRAAIEIGT